MSDEKENKITDERNENLMESGWAVKKDARRHLECSIPELAASPFCGKGYHNG
jgi:hypothetical protein